MTTNDPVSDSDTERNDGSTAEYGALDTFCPPELAAWMAAGSHHQQYHNNDPKARNGFDYRNGKQPQQIHHDDEDETTHAISVSTGLIDSMESKRGMGEGEGNGDDDDEDAALESLLGKIGISSIEDNTPAGEALRANASVHVGKLGKVARSLHAQTLRKIVKRATWRAKSGNVRGKPPRIPPLRPTAHEATSSGVEIYVVEEEEDDDDDDDDAESKEDDNDDDDVDEDVGLLPTVPPPEIPTTTPQVEATKAQTDMIDETASDIPAEVVAGTMETGRKVLGTVDPHSILQSQRWRRKRRKSKKSKRKSYVKGKVIDGQHELYTLSIAVMIGVRTSIAKTNALMNSLKGHKRWLTTDDFVASEKYEFKPSGGPNTPPHPLSHTFKFKDYSPLAFAYLRRMFGVNEFDFLLSVCGNANFIEFISNAKSGQFFFYSSDGKYLIKTMTNDESKFLRRILPHYFRHCAKNPNTLLPRFLGMYRVKLYHLRRNVKFIIMNSVYYTDKSLHQFYDLKGSKAGRNAKPGQDVLKDNDLRKRLPEEAIVLPQDVRERLREQIVLDCDFLRTMKIMDYSLLVGVHRIPYKKLRPTKNISEIGLKLSELLESHRIGQAAKSKSNRKSWRSEVSRSQREQHPNDDDGGHASDASIDDDDESSYLDGSENNLRYDHISGDDSTLGDRSLAHKAEIEVKKEQTVERIYWPFHRLYDIHGHRRVTESPCVHCGEAPCMCHGQHELRQKLGIPDFVPPLSTRKDGGLMMDTSSLKLPLRHKGPQGEQLYEGKIFYLGIIDILQQYNVRKRVESRYRRVQIAGGEEPSCTHPNFYADRFIRFFDEYSQLNPPQQESASPRSITVRLSKSTEEEKEEIENVRGANDNPFEVEFSPR